VPTGALSGFSSGCSNADSTLPPSPFEAAFVSLAHTDEDIDGFLSAAAQTLLTLGDLRA
jgi:glutamate-1-semialdehyde aminotransferase